MLYIKISDNMSVYFSDFFQLFIYSWVGRNIILRNASINCF